MNYRKAARHRMGIPFFPFMIIAGVLIFGAIVMLLWNAILPPVTHVNELTYWQAVGLLVLCRILFGGFRGRPGGFGPPGPWRHGPPWRQKWMNMTDDEKAKFKEEWKRRCEPPQNQ